MRTIAWLLGILALISTLFLGLNWSSARRGANAATGAISRAQRSLANWEFAADQSAADQETRITHGRSKLAIDDWNLQLAAQQGSSKAQRQSETAGLLARRDADRERLDAAERNLQGLRSRDPHAVEARERMAAAQRSLSVYQGALRRDETLAWNVALMWLAFVLAAPFAAQREDPVVSV